MQEIGDTGNAIDLEIFSQDSQDLRDVRDVRQFYRIPSEAIRTISKKATNRSETETQTEAAVCPWNERTRVSAARSIAEDRETSDRHRWQVRLDLQAEKTAAERSRFEVDEDEAREEDRERARGRRRDGKRNVEGEPRGSELSRAISFAERSSFGSANAAVPRRNRKLRLGFHLRCCAESWCAPWRNSP